MNGTHFHPSWFVFAMRGWYTGCPRCEGIADAGACPTTGQKTWGSFSVSYDAIAYTRPLGAASNDVIIGGRVRLSGWLVYHMHTPGSATCDVMLCGVVRVYLAVRDLQTELTVHQSDPAKFKGGCGAQGRLLRLHRCCGRRRWSGGGT